MMIQKQNMQKLLKAALCMRFIDLSVCLSIHSSVSPARARNSLTEGHRNVKSQWLVYFAMPF